MKQPQVRALARAGFISPQRGPRGQYQFTFQDLVLLRTASLLRLARVPEQRMQHAFACLKQQLAPDESLSSLQIEARGEHIVARDGERAWDVETQQLQLEFPGQPVVVRQLAMHHQDALEAVRWFEHGVDVESESPAEARVAYENAVRLDPTHADAHVNLGRLLYQKGLVAQAAECYRLALLQTRHATAAFNLGIALEDMGKRKEAIQAYRTALAMDETMSDAHYNLARLYEAAGDRLAAIRHLKACRS